MRRPLISVMIGVYDGVRYVAEAIDSVLDQTYAPVELIVCDDGSTDGSSEVVKSYGSRLTYVRQENRGNGAARNTALAHAHGDLLAFLDADDRFVPGKLDRQMSALEADPALDMVFGHVREFYSDELPDDLRSRIRPPADVPVPGVTPSLMLIRRSSFERVGTFSETLRVGVTVDWYARAMEQGLRGLVLPQVVLERRLHAGNNGLRESASRSHYAHVLKAAMDRRRRLASVAGRTQIAPHEG